MSKIKNIKDLREDLLVKYEAAESSSQVNELGTYTATASAIIRSLKTELDYNKFQNNNKKIPFLES